MIKSSRSEAFKMGFEAFFANRSTNPFVYGSVEAAEWLNGFVTAQEMRQAGAC